MAGELSVMEYVFYLVIFAACVYVIAGIVHSTFLGSTTIERTELPPSVSREINQLFPDFAAKTIKRHRARHRYELNGSCRGKPSQVTVSLTPEAELSIVEYSQAADQKPFIKLSSLASSQIPAKLAQVLQLFLADDQAKMETTRAERGIMGNRNAFRIEVDSFKYHYRFDITDSGELLKFSKKEAA
jgi:hypothetical protein